MEVKNLTTNQVAYFSNVQTQKGSEVQQTTGEKQKTDTLEISEKAFELQKKNQKDLSLIMKRIDEGYYNKKEVIDATAEFILAEIAG